MAKKIDVFQNYEDPEIKHLQVVYLNHHGFTAKDIAKWTGYAVSTIRNYACKYLELLEKAKKVFYHITKKIKAALQNGKQLVYLYKFYSKDGQLICSKVGTTTRSPEQRLQEEIRYYCNHGITVADSKICSVIDCGDIPAEGAESETRAYFIRRYPKAFCKNDRFFGVDIPTPIFNKVVKNYLTLGDPEVA